MTVPEALSRPSPEPSQPPAPSPGASFEGTFLKTPRIALLGNPNTGKTSLFNWLCGLRAKTANFPGTTTSIRIGHAVLTAPGHGVEIVDLPGLYSMALDLPEAEVCREALAQDGGIPQVDALVVVVDAANLERNLCLVAELLHYGQPTVIALNMIDLAARRGLTIDVHRLETELGCPVVPVMARKGDGLPQLREVLHKVLEAEVAAHPGPAASLPAAGSDGAAAREEWAEELVGRSVRSGGEEPASAQVWTDRLDRVFTHPVLGVVIFAAVMTSLFWALFSFASVPMDLIEASFTHLGGGLATILPEGALRDFLVDGVVGGIAGTVVFLPQICLLFFLISLLEDTGYLARAAFVMDRMLRRFGLPGHAFVPLLSSHACALPGIVSARLIPDRPDRLTTILVAPFMSCSARLPVYVLLTGLLFADRPFWAGLAFAGCYALGAGVALLSAAVARRSLLPGPSRPMVLELPSYKTPSLRSALIEAKDQGLAFLHKAGTVILAICVVMWWLSAYPQTEPPPEAVSLRTQAEAAAPAQAEELLAEAEHLENRAAQAGSFAGQLGHAVQPVFAPLGFDWQLTVGVLTSFLAREVFVSTMAVLLVGDAEADVEEAGVLDRIRNAERDDGSPLFTPATAASLLVFFVLAMQCLPTLVLTHRETGSWKWPVLQLGYMTGVAYLFALATYHGLHWLGVA